MKLLVIGHARHGKDTVCEMLRDEFGLKFQNSSEFCASEFIFDVLKDKYGYQTHKDCFEDRHNHRSEWFDLISNFCKPDAAKLGKRIFTDNDIYCGLRNRREFDALKAEHIFDYCVWIDRSKLLPPESKSSMNLEPSLADFIIDNNKDLDHLKIQLVNVMKNIFK